MHTSRKSIVRTRAGLRRGLGADSAGRSSLADDGADATAIRNRFILDDYFGAAIDFTEPVLHRGDRLSRQFGQFVFQNFDADVHPVDRENKQGSTCSPRALNTRTGPWGMMEPFLEGQVRRG